MSSILYDAPGPKARRMTVIVSIVAAAVVVIGAYFLVYRPLERNGHLSMELWGPLIDPGNENFEQLWQRFGDGFRATIIAAVQNSTDSGSIVIKVAPTAVPGSTRLARYLRLIMLHMSCTMDSEHRNKLTASCSSSRPWTFPRRHRTRRISALRRIPTGMPPIRSRWPPSSTRSA